LSVASNFGHKALLLEKLAHQAQRCSGIAAALYHHVEDLTFVADGAPEAHPLAGDSGPPSRLRASGCLDRGAATVAGAR
jgi:hypothetical protein